ncbi:MAG: S41 family peptidase [Bacteroidota bacterium]
MLKLYFPIVLILWLGAFGYGQTPHLNADSLKADFKLLRDVLQRYHPGMNRYKHPHKVNADFDLSEKDFVASQDVKEAYLSLHRATSKVQCGHTYPNFWNQERAIREALFELEDKLPFTLALVQDKMYIHKDVSGNGLKPNTEILTVNGIAVADIVKNLKHYRRLDGNNMAKFYIDFSITGKGKYEAFDVIFPMLYPPVNGKYQLTVSYLERDTIPVEVAAISREKRKTLLNLVGDDKAKLWEKDFIGDSIATLKLGTFAVWNMKLDWKAYLENFFKETKEKNSKYLLLDLRGNEGGLMEVYWELFKYLTEEPLRLKRDAQRTVYEMVRDEFKSYLETYDQTYFDLTGKVTKKGYDFYEFNDAGLKYLEVKPSQYAFAGEIFVLIDSANSSATYYLAKFLKQNQLAKLIGATTGGNMMGTNGGQFFLLKLPYTKLEVDVPLIGYYPHETAEDGGLKPDILVERNFRYYFNKWTMENDLDRAAFFETIAQD